MFICYIVVSLPQARNSPNLYSLPLASNVPPGGDNLAADFSRELADYTIYVIDTAGGDKVPRKGGPGITQSDLLIVNKIDLADGKPTLKAFAPIILSTILIYIFITLIAVGASIDVMKRDAALMRGEGPTVMGSVKHGDGIDEIITCIEKAVEKAGCISLKK